MAAWSEPLLVAHTTLLEILCHGSIMETGPRHKVSSDILVKPGIEPAIPGLQGKWLFHYSSAAPEYVGRSANYHGSIDLVSI